jgi:hypothetical protein
LKITFNHVADPLPSIVRRGSQTTQSAYDLPSSLMSGLQNEKVAAASKKLDTKLIALAVHATGSEA